MPQNNQWYDKEMSANPHDDSSSEESKDKHRIRVACNQCRRKKVKCDGQFPCSNCQMSKKGDCQYEDRPTKRKRLDQGKAKKDQVLEGLENRLLRLEKVITQMSEKLDQLVETPNEVSKSPQWEKVAEEKVIPHEQVTEVSEISEGGNVSIGSKTEVYFGSHCIMCIFSDKSLDFMDEIIGDTEEQVTLPIRNMPMVFLNKCKDFMIKWIDPPVVDSKRKQQLLLKPFPPNSDLVRDLLDVYKTEGPLIIMDNEPVSALFDAYYGNQSLQPKEKRRFKISEFLLMTSVLLLALSTAIGKVTRKNSLDDLGLRAIHKLSLSEMNALKSSLLDNAIFYYHRISVINDGMESISAILHLMVFVETNYTCMYVSYMLVMVAVRFAQQMGLHRLETYEGLPVAEQLRRKKLWWLCHYFDMETCFRTGNAPAMNAAELPKYNMDEIRDVWSKEQFLRTGVVEPYTETSVSQILRDTRAFGNTIYLHLYLVLLTRIRSKTYTRLFSTSAMHESEDNLVAALDEINVEMAELANSLPQEDQCAFFGDPRFEEFDRSISTKGGIFLEAHFSYLAHLMLINRLPFVNGYEIKTRKKYRDLSSKAARTILALSMHVNRSKTSDNYYYWLIFFPISAFLSVTAGIINHPDAEDAGTDLDMLIDSSISFFDSLSQVSQGVSPIVLSDIDNLMGLVVSLMLRVVVRFYEKKKNIKIIDNNPRLKEHFKRIKLNFPDIFQSRDELKSKICTYLSKTTNKRPVMFGNSGGLFTGIYSNSSLRSDTKKSSDPSSSVSSQESPFPVNVESPAQTFFSKNDNLFVDDLFRGFVNEDDISSMFYSQINNLPNFFADVQ